MKTQAKYSYRNPKVWCVQPPKERKQTLCNDLYNDQYNNPYNDPYNDPYDNPYDNPYNDSTDDSSANPSDDPYRTRYKNAYTDLHNKDINPSILALEAKFDLAIENFFASLTMSKTPATSIPKFVTVYEDDNPENCNNVDYHYPAYNADNVDEHLWPDNVDNNFEDNFDFDDFDTNNDDNPDDNANPDIFLSVSSVPNAANSLHATMADRAHCLLLTVLLSGSHPRMNNLVSLLPSNHESPLPPPEPPPPVTSNLVFQQHCNLPGHNSPGSTKTFTPLCTLQYSFFTPLRTISSFSRHLRVQLPDVRSVGG